MKMCLLCLICLSETNTYYWKQNKHRHNWRDHAKPNNLFDHPGKQTCLKDLGTDSSFKTDRNGDEEVSKPSRSKSKFTCKYTCRDREPSRLRCNKKIKMLKKSRLSTKRIITKHYIWYNTSHSPAIKKKTFHPLISEFTLPLDCVEVDLWEKL